MIVTVTLNAAMDRTLLVPNFQLGQRHRASLGFASAGGKGVNVARALRRLGVPVIATGFAGGRTGVHIADGLTEEGILNDFVRIEGESRTSLALLDPIADRYTEINEWGPEVTEEELEALREKLGYLTQSASYVVFAGSLPRNVPTDFYGEIIRELSRRQVLVVLDAEGDALRQGVEAEPHLVAPNIREAEGLVGHEFSGDGDTAAGLEEIAELGARNVLITRRGGLLRARPGRLAGEARAGRRAAARGGLDDRRGGHASRRVPGRAGRGPLRRGLRAPRRRGGCRVRARSRAGPLRPEGRGRGRGPRLDRGPEPRRTGRLSPGAPRGVVKSRCYDRRA